MKSHKNRVTVQALREMKLSGEKITMLTAYDFFTARVLDQSVSESWMPVPIRLRSHHGKESAIFRFGPSGSSLLTRPKRLRGGPPASEPAAVTL